MQVKHFPAPGETVLSPSYEWLPGGKGMNQAIAAARAGAKVAMVGKIGDDGFGTRALNTLKREGVSVSGIAVSETLPTGCATVFIDEAGENQIVVAQGANADVSPDQVPDEILGPQHVLLLQMEIRGESNLNVLERAAKLGATTILNLAPAQTLPREALGHLDYLIVNSIEAAAIAAKLGLKIETDGLKLAHALSVNFDLTCIVTLGPNGSVGVGNGKGWHVPAYPVPEIVDRTGAGDAYCGAFAAAIHAKASVPEAMRRASIAGSLAVMAKGAQSSIPYVDDITAALETFAPAQEISI